MPLALRSLGLESLRELAKDLQLQDFAGLGKEALLLTLEAVFSERDFDTSDVSSASHVAAPGKATAAPLLSPSPMVHAPSLFSPITLPPPSHFDVREHNRASRWGLWRENFESYLAAVGDFDSNRKKAILFYCAGPGLKRLFEGHSFSESSYEQLLATIENRFCSANTVPFNRFKLSELAQGKGESTDDYASRLRLEARFCKLKCQACNASFTDEYLFDIILRNTSLPQLRTRVFERGLSKLDELLTSARNLEISVSQAARMNTNKVVPEPDTISVANSSSSGTRPRNIDRRSGQVVRLEVPSHLLPGVSFVPAAM